MTNEILYLNPSRQHDNLGVNGYGTEADNMMRVAKVVKGKLDAKGILKKVVLTEGLTLSQAIAESNAVGATLHLDIHSDAGGGRGCTGLYKSDNGKKFITCIYNRVSALTPSADRGLSLRTDLGALNQTHAIAGLIECFFHDNAEDVKFYNANLDAIAQAIVDGILDYLGIATMVYTPSKPVAPVNSNVDAMVLRIQRNLNRLKITDDSGQSLVEDGVPGARTKQAIKKFQDIVNITVDGIPGNVTLNAMNDILLKPLMRFGVVNRNAAKYIQWRMGITRDGVFGTDTAAHVRSYQTSKGFKADGIVGYDTWNALIGA
jgi:N-acetylmuramoyl-L-alanine amidase